MDYIHFPITSIAQDFQFNHSMSCQLCSHTGHYFLHLLVTLALSVLGNSTHLEPPSRHLSTTYTSHRHTMLPDINNWNLGLLWWVSGKESACQCRGNRFNPQSGKIPQTTWQLSPWATTTEAWVPWSPCSTTREATTMRSPCTKTKESLPSSTTREKTEQGWRPSTARNK